MDVCLKCSVPANFKCSRCNEVYYCGKNCQKDDWKRHKVACNEFAQRTSTKYKTITTNDELNNLYQNNIRTFNNPHDLMDMFRQTPIPKSETAYEACKRLNVFDEYNAMKDRKDMNGFDEARFLILRATVKMVNFDPVSGDMKPNMNDEDKLLWESIKTDIIEGGKALYEFDGMDGMRDPLVWSFIPRRFHRDIDIRWSGIGEWRS